MQRLIDANALLSKMVNEPVKSVDGVDFDADYDKAAAVNSASQLYRQAGNSIVVNCLVAIFGQMIEGKDDVYGR